MPIAKKWDEFGPTKAAAAPATAGVYELGRTRPYPGLDVYTTYVGSATNLREKLQAEVALKKSELSGMQYCRWEETNNYAQRERQLLEEYKQQTGKLPEINELRGTKL